MKYNRNLLTDAINEKFGKLITNLIVAEAFSMSVPDQLFANEMTGTNYRDLAIFALETLKTVDNDLLISALENVKGGTADQKYLINTIKDIHDEVLSDICIRVLMEAENVSGDKKLTEFVDETSLTPAEMKKITSKTSDELSLDEISEIVKNKVINTIKSEKADYDKAEDIKAQITEVIDANNTEPSDDDLDNNEPNPEVSDTDNDALKEAYESFMRIHTKITDAREPVTLFSRINEVLSYNLNACTESTGEIPYSDIARVITGNTISLFNASENMSSPVVALLSGALNANNPNTTNNAMNGTVLTMTLLEVLNSLHMLKHCMKEIKEFICKDTKPVASMSSTEVLAKVSEDLTTDYNKAKASGDKDAMKELKKQVALSKAKVIELGEKEEIDITDTKKALTDIEDDIDDDLEFGTESVAFNPVKSFREKMVDDSNTSQMKVLSRAINYHKDYKTADVMVNESTGTVSVKFKKTGGIPGETLSLCMEKYKVDSRSFTDIISSGIIANGLESSIDFKFK